MFSQSVKIKNPFCPSITLSSLTLPLAALHLLEGSQFPPRLTIRQSEGYRSAPIGAQGQCHTRRGHRDSRGRMLGLADVINKAAVMDCLV